MAKFEVGKTVATRKVFDKSNENEDFKKFVDSSWLRYINCDWGEMDEEDIEENNEAVKNGDRILASYESKDLGTKIWIITEWDRSVTTILFPDEY